MNAALKDQMMIQNEANGETWRWKQRDALEVLQVKDVYIDIIETVTGVICCSGEDEAAVEARG
jgi:succinylglutamate desuccinylase